MIKILVSGWTKGSPNYLDALAACGAWAVHEYLPASGEGYDGLVLSGGEDVDPAFYGEDFDGSGEPDRLRDEAEIALAREFMAAGKPILAVCRGHQLLNVALGGSLVQDLGDELRPFHANWADIERVVHPIRAAEGSLMHELYGEVFPVNSSHHQALKTLGRGLFATAWSESGIVEAMQHETLPIISVQFHPERMTGRFAAADRVDGKAIFERFIEMCG